MSQALDELVDVERHEEWQKEIIYQQKFYSDQNSSAAVARKEAVTIRQKKLEEAVNGGQKVIADYLFNVLGLSNSDQAFQLVPDLPNPLTEGEMKDLPLHAERELSLRLHNSITPAQAAQPAVWTLCHAVWIAKGRFGLNLSAVFCEVADNLEARTRNFLRRTGGLRPVRGNTSPLVDCQIAAAWWRYRIARETSEVAQNSGTNLDVHDAHQVLRPRTVWENFVTMSLRQATAVCAPRSRAAAVAVLHDDLASNQRGATREQVQAVLRELARLSHSHSLWHAPWDLLIDTATRGLNNTEADESPEND